ncbi:MAG: CDP-glycerol glycerophosphotransferase family protein [Oscillospiraceae bacterium]|nr:CDP-glycerol glycerophosphotransferase family protein [Oscillospiraceae bacterium]
MKNHVKVLLYKIVRFIFRILFAPFRLQDKVFFLNFSGKCYADNPKYISLKLHELYPQYKQVWAKYPGYSFETPNYIEVVNWGSLKMMYEMGTSKVWVSSHWLRLWMPKKKQQYFIETWHGGLGFKKIEGDIEDELTEREINTGKYNAELIDLLISNSAWLTAIYKRAFWGYNGEILECGYPKTDSFEKIAHEKYGEIREKLEIPRDVRIVMYAPTFRNESETEIFRYDYSRVIAELEKKTGDKWIFLLRLHPLLSKLSSDLQVKKPWFRDVSDYDDMQELTLASDVFITDYSSGIFDFALTGRPGFLYAPDLEKYTEERGLYFDLRDLPFPLCQTEEELVTAVGLFNEISYQTQLEDFFAQTGLIRTQDSAERICKRIDAVISECSR